MKEQEKQSVLEKQNVLAYQQEQGVHKTLTLKRALGKQLLVEYYDCDALILNHKETIRQLMIEAAQLAKATIVTDIFHTFSPQGISGVVVIAESHFAIHTWPEHGCASVDFFSCSDSLDLARAADFLKEQFGAKEMNQQEILRGEYTNLEYGDNLS